MHIVLMKGKPIPEGLKMYVLSESETGYILNAFLQHKKLKTPKEEHGANFGIVMQLLEGDNISDGKEWSLLDQGFTVSVCILAPFVSEDVWCYLLLREYVTENVKLRRIL